MKKLSTLELIMYYFSCILSLGFWWLVKIVIKKAILESKNENN